MKRFVASVICFAFLIPVFYVNASDAGAEIVMVSDTAEIAYEKDCHRRLPIASTTKIVTAVIVLENVSDLSRKILVPAEACDIEGSSVYLYPDETITVEALLYGLMLNSGNDAATALAITVGGSVDGFVTMMNDFAQKLRLKDTHFANPHGLEDEAHYSSAYDMALVMRYAMQNDDFVRISSTKSISFRKENGETHYFSNHNRLLREYEYSVCGKTGYIKASGRCLVSSAEKDGVLLICVTLSCGDDFNRHIELFNNEFKEYKLFDAEDHSEIQLNAVGAENDIFYANVNECVMLPFKNTSDTAYVTKRIISENFHYAPIHFGDKVGTVVYYINGFECARKNLVAVNSAGRKQKKSFVQKIIDFFGSLFN